MNLKLLLFLSLSFQIHAQFGPKQTVWNRGGYQVITFDLDGDGDQDIIETGNERISWFENIDGQGSFSEAQIISSLLDWRSVSASDIDGDGDLDIIASANLWLHPAEVGKISWYENLNGLGSFGGEQEIEFDFDLLITSDLIPTDIDNDGDIDLISGANSKIYWFENINGLGEFSDMQLIADDISYLTDLKAEDIDNDGDLDLILCSLQDDQLSWFENTDGLGNYGVKQVISTNNGVISRIDINDINGDNFKDIITISNDSKEVSWFENLDSNGSFGSKQIIDTFEELGTKIMSKDIDNDGDVDILTASYEPPFGIGLMSWYENTNGDGLFGPKLIIHEEKNFGFTLYASDIDNDSDIDVVGSSPTQIAWFENLTPLTIDNFFFLNFKIFPNPTSKIINVQSENHITELKLFNQLGQLILLRPNANSIDLSNFQAGIYFIQLMDINGISSFKKIIKE